MPLYEYQCQECGHHFEARQKFSEAPLDQCPVCRGVVRKMISQTGFALKGGGWFDQGYSAGQACSTPKTEACNSCPKAAAS